MSFWEFLFGRKAENQPTKTAARAERASSSNPQIQKWGSSEGGSTGNGSTGGGGGGGYSGARGGGQDRSTNTYQGQYTGERDRRATFSGGAPLTQQELYESTPRENPRIESRKEVEAEDNAFDRNLAAWENRDDYLKGVAVTQLDEAAYQKLTPEQRALVDVNTARYSAMSADVESDGEADATYNSRIQELFKGNDSKAYSPMSLTVAEGFGLTDKKNDALSYFTTDSLASQSDIDNLGRELNETASANSEIVARKEMMEALANGALAKAEASGISTTELSKQFRENNPLLFQSTFDQTKVGSYAIPTAEERASQTGDEKTRDLDTVYTAMLSGAPGNEMEDMLSIMDRAHGLDRNEVANYLELRLRQDEEANRLGLQPSFAGVLDVTQVPDPATIRAAYFEGAE